MRFEKPGEVEMGLRPDAHHHAVGVTGPGTNGTPPLSLQSGSVADRNAGHF